MSHCRCLQRRTVQIGRIAHISTRKRPTGKNPKLPLGPATAGATNSEKNEEGISKDNPQLPDLKQPHVCCSEQPIFIEFRAFRSSRYPRLRRLMLLRTTAGVRQNRRDSIPMHRLQRRHLKSGIFCVPLSRGPQSPSFQLSHIISLLDSHENTTVLPDCQKEAERPPTLVSFSRSP